VVVLPSEDRLNWPLVCNSLVVSGAAAALAVAGGALAALWFAGCAKPLARAVFGGRRRGAGAAAVPGGQLLD
jgi:hypothetical protein